MFTLQGPGRRVVPALECDEPGPAQPVTDGQCLHEAVGGEVRGAGVEHLAHADEVVQCADRLFQRGGRVVEVELIQVDVVGSEAAKGRFAGCADVTAAVCATVRAPGGGTQAFAAILQRHSVTCGARDR